MSMNANADNPLDDRPRDPDCRVTDTDIHVRRSVTGEGDAEVEKFSVAAGGRTYLLDGTLEEAEEQVKLILGEIR